MARRRFTKADPAKQRALLDAAAQEFAAHGYEGASLNRIIAAAALSKGGFYYYFEDKADLAATVLREHVGHYLDLIRAAEPKDGEDFWAAMATLTRSSLDELFKTPGEADLVTRLGMAAIQDEHLASHLVPMIQEQTDVVVAQWKKGQALGAVRADLPVELLIGVVGAVKQALSRSLLQPNAKADPAAIEKVAAIQLDLIRRIAEPRPAPKERTP